MTLQEVAVGPLAEIEDPGCREFTIGDGEWPFKGFVVRQGDSVFAYKNACMHVGSPLNWMPDGFLTKDRKSIMCSMHGAQYEIDSGLCFAGPCRGKYLQKVDVEVRDGVVYVRGPEAAF